MSDDLKDQLDVLVTRAIIEAERLDDAGSPAAAQAYAQVSRYEEALAALLPAIDLEGAVARTGAVSAALRAGDLDRARRLARIYAADRSLPRSWRDELDGVFARLAPHGFGSPDPLRRIHASVRERFREQAA